MSTPKNLPLKEAILLATNHTVHTNTAMRWKIHGYRGKDGQMHKIPTVKVGRVVMTTVEDVQAWVAACNKLPEPKQRRTGKQAMERLRKVAASI